MRSEAHAAAINPDQWYVVGRSYEISKGKVHAVTLWNQAIALFRDGRGAIRAMEDRCPHRQVKLSHGVIVDDSLECAYHGWRFDGEGRCCHVPYLKSQQRLPGCRLRIFPVQERDGFIWLFPGQPDKAGSVPVLELPEWDHLNHIASVAVIDVEAHFSFLIENLMDMHHGHLHAKHQAWANASLLRLEQGEARVDAFYEAQSFHRIDSILSVAQLFIPPLRRLHLQPLDVSYVYPHWKSRLGDDFRLYGLLCPVGPTRTKAYLIHFTSLRTFKQLHKLPIGFRRWVKDRMSNLARPLLESLIRQDVLMIEEEQSYFLNRQNDAKGIELNPTLMAVQKLVTLQASQPSADTPVRLKG